MRRRFFTFSDVSLGQKTSKGTVAARKPCVQTGVARCRAFVYRAGGATCGNNGVEVGNDETSKFQKIEQFEENVRVCAADFHDRHILAGQFRCVRLRLLQLSDDDGQQQTLTGAFDQYCFVGKEKIAARKSQVLEEKLSVLRLRCAQPFPKILYFGLRTPVASSADVARKYRIDSKPAALATWDECVDTMNCTGQGKGAASSALSWERSSTPGE